MQGGAAVAGRRGVRPRLIGLAAAQGPSTNLTSSSGRSAEELRSKIFEGAGGAGGQAAGP